MTLPINAARLTLLWSAFLMVPLARADAPHTFDGKHDITTIDLTVVYLMPKDRMAMADWKERVDYYTKRIEAFHARESAGKSTLKIHTHPEPMVVGQSAEELRGKEPNGTFFNSTNEAKKVLKWPGERGKRVPDHLGLERDQLAGAGRLHADKNR